MAADQQFCLRWNNHQSTLISVFDTLLENGTLVDCTLAAEGQYLKAHKVVLSACSPYMETLLSQNYDKHPILILKDVKFTELKSMMDYMYRGEVNISQDQLGTFLKAAESLQIKGLSENGEGDARDVGSTNANPPPPRRPPATRPEPEAAQSPAHRSRDGSVSPSSRKRRRLRRNSDDGDNHIESNSCDVPAQSTPVPNIPASITTTPIRTPIVKPEVNDRLDHNTLPAESGLLKEKIEPAEPLLEPKTEYLEDLNNDDSVEDLTLDDDDEMDMSQMSNLSNMSRPGPSHGADLSNQGFPPWQLGNQSGTDEVFMAAQEAVNAHRDSQENDSFFPICTYIGEIPFEVASQKPYDWFSNLFTHQISENSCQTSPETSQPNLVNVIEQQNTEDQRASRTNVDRPRSYISLNMFLSESNEQSDPPSESSASQSSNQTNTTKKGQNSIDKKPKKGVGRPKKRKAIRIVSRTNDLASFKETRERLKSLFSLETPLDSSTEGFENDSISNEDETTLSLKNERYCFRERRKSEKNNDTEKNTSSSSKKIVTVNCNAVSNRQEVELNTKENSANKSSESQSQLENNKTLSDADEFNNLQIISKRQSLRLRELSESKLTSSEANKQTQGTSDKETLIKSISIEGAEHLEKTPKKRPIGRPRSLNYTTIRIPSGRPRGRPKKIQQKIKTSLTTTEMQIEIKRTKETSVERVWTEPVLGQHESSRKTLKHSSVTLTQPNMTLTSKPKARPDKRRFLGLQNGKIAPLLPEKSTLESTSLNNSEHQNNNKPSIATQDLPVNNVQNLEEVPLAKRLEGLTSRPREVTILSSKLNSENRLQTKYSFKMLDARSKLENFMHLRKTTKLKIRSQNKIRREKKREKIHFEKSNSSIEKCPGQDKILFNGKLFNPTDSYNVDSSEISPLVTPTSALSVNNIVYEETHLVDENSPKPLCELPVQPILPMVNQDSLLTEKNTNKPGNSQNISALRVELGEIPIDKEKRISNSPNNSEDELMKVDVPLENQEPCDTIENKFKTSSKTDDIIHEKISDDISFSSEKNSTTEEDEDALQKLKETLNYAQPKITEEPPKKIKVNIYISSEEEDSFYVMAENIDKSSEENKETGEETLNTSFEDDNEPLGKLKEKLKPFSDEDEMPLKIVREKLQTNLEEDEIPLERIKEKLSSSKLSDLET